MGFGPTKVPLTVTNLRTETVADMNRGRLRGWAIAGAALLAALAWLSYPDFVSVLAFSLGAVAATGLAVWSHWLLKDAEREGSSGGGEEEPTEVDTGARD